MRYWLYRVEKTDFEKMNNLDVIEIDYLPEPVEDNDLLVVFVSEILHVMGPYKKEGKALWALGKPSQETLRDMRPFYKNLSFISHVGPRTYKIFAKKVKEIAKEDYELLTHDMC